MKFRVLALDYDGTIAVDGVLDSGVREAVGQARSCGVSVLLVTGRILADLERLLGDLGLFDAVVAENGAVLYFPESGRSLLLASPPPQVFLDELRHREIPFLAGECVVETDAARAGAVLGAVRDTRMPLALLFNRERLMVLPQAISKATGLREVLRALRLSGHNAVAIGDAENDHELLAACELGVAVGWGSPVLAATADEVLPGSGPPAVGEFVKVLLERPNLDSPGRRRRLVHLGVRGGGEPFALSLRGRNLLIAGDTQSGKSWIAGLLCEQLVLQRYCVCIVDPEGEYAGLESLPSVVVFDADPHPPELDDLERTLRYPDVSVVVDLARLVLERKRLYVRSLLARLRALRAATGLPHRVVIDEAHYFLHDGQMSDLLDDEPGGYTLVTWHASQLHPEVLGSADTILVTRVSDRDEAEALRALRSPDQDRDRWLATLSGLQVNEAALLPGSGESGDHLVRFRISSRMTEHVRHQHKYLTTPVPRGQEFVFADREGRGVRRARSLADLLAMLSSHTEIDDYLRRGDVSRWVRDACGDAALANRVQMLEERFAAGCLQQPREAITMVIRERYGRLATTSSGAASAGSADTTGERR